MNTCSLISSLFIIQNLYIYIRNSTSTFYYYKIYPTYGQIIFRSDSINRNSEAETSTTMNDSSNSCFSIRTERSDEESILLVSSNNPKKRAAGRKKFKETRHPVFRGVRKRNKDKWVCEIREPTKQKRIWLGTYPTAEMAARAHDVAALALKGELAALNFADSAWRLQVPVSKDPKELRQAAARAAEAFEPVRDVAPNPCLFGIKEWVANMEEESLFSPNPSLFGSHFNWDDHVESDVEVSLWNYTI